MELLHLTEQQVVQECSPAMLRRVMFIINARDVAERDAANKPNLIPPKPSSRR